MASSIFIDAAGGFSQAGGTTTSSVPVLFPDGIASAPSVAFATDTNTGFMHPGAGSVDFVAGGSQTLRFSNAALTFLSPTSALTSTAAGKLTLTGTTPMLQFGGTSSSFPALKQSSATLQARLADDTAFANVSANAFQTTTALIATGGGSGTPAFVASSTGGTNQPATANQNGWIRMQDSGGATIWVPVWK